MENRNGQGIFLGVVGVATLVVAIIGATFAFFSAQIQGDNNVEAEAYVFNSSLSVSEISSKEGLASNGLIPMADDMVNTAVNATKTCIDTQNYDACEVYELAFENDGSAPVTFNGKLTIASGENKFQNEHLQLVEFGAQTEQSLGNLAKTKTQALPLAGDITLEEITVPVGGKTIYIAVYLKELEDANDADMGATFKASLTYTATTGETLSAKF